MAAMAAAVPYGIMGDDDIDTDPHEFFGELLSTVASPLGIAELDLDVLALRVAKGVRNRARKHQRTDAGAMQTPARQ